MKRPLLFLLFIIFFGPIQAQIISTVAGNGATSGDGVPATDASFGELGGLCMDASGNLYIADAGNHRVRKVDRHGIITTVAGHQLPAFDTGGYNGDNIPATAALLKNPFGIAIDAAGNLYFTDDYNLRVRKVNTDGIISTIAGNGTFGYTGDNGPATNATIGHCAGLCLDPVGNVYFVDVSHYVIRKINTEGLITTVAGTGVGGYSGDGGPATAAKIATLWICSDKVGNIYTAEYSGQSIRRINTDGIITTVAGTGVAGVSPDGTPASVAELNTPSTVRIDNSGNILFGETGSHVVRKIAADGTLVTIAGDRTAGYSGDGGPATDAELDAPSDIYEDLDGGLYIVDFVYGVVRYVANPLSVNITHPIESSLVMYPSPFTRAFEITVKSQISEAVTIHVLDAVGREIEVIPAATNKTREVTIDGPSGFYTIIAVGKSGVIAGKIVKA